MTPVTLEAKVDSDGHLRLLIPLGEMWAGQPAKIVVAGIPPEMSQEEWVLGISKLAGKWQGRL